MFNGEAVSLPSGAAVLPPVTPSPSPNPSNAAQKLSKFSRESFEEMKQSPGLTSGDMKDPLNFLDPLWSLKKKWDPSRSVLDGRWRRIQGYSTFGVEAIFDVAHRYWMPSINVLLDWGLMVIKEEVEYHW